jgi:hypothetical protein
MVKGAVKEKHAQQGADRHVFIMSCIDAHRQVQDDAEQIEHGSLGKKFPEPHHAFRGGRSLARRQEARHHEVPCHHEEERHGDPRQHPGEKKIRPFMECVQGRGMDSDDCQGGNDPKSVQPAVIGFRPHLSTSILSK